MFGFGHCARLRTHSQDLDLRTSEFGYEMCCIYPSNSCRWVLWVGCSHVGRVPYPREWWKWTYRRFEESQLHVYDAISVDYIIALSCIYVNYIQLTCMDAVHTQSLFCIYEIVPRCNLESQTPTMLRVRWGRFRALDYGPTTSSM